MPKGYVYILTNPSFRENWVKIGKTSKPVDVRSKQLDNTAVPLRYEIFAVLKTEKYDEAETYVQDQIDILTKSRIRQNREFFNISPKIAAEVFETVAKLLVKLGQEAEVIYYKDGKELPKQNQKENPKKSTVSNNSSIESKDKSSIKVAIDKKTTQTLQISSYTFDEHLNKCNDIIKRHLNRLRNFIKEIDETIKEEPKKHYINYTAYKTAKIFASIVVNKDKLLLYLKLNPKEIQIPNDSRTKIFDVTNVGHLGNGDLEITIEDIGNFADSQKYIKKAFENISE